MPGLTVLGIRVLEIFFSFFNFAEVDFFHLFFEILFKFV